MKEVLASLPIYIQIRDHLLESIESGLFLPGTAIPSESELAKTYDVTRLTVRAALEELQRDGLVRAVQGKGVYVVGERINRDLNTLKGFTRSMRELNLEAKNNVISRYTREAGALYSKIFGISENDLIHRIKRVSEANKIAIALEEIFVPVSVLPNLPDLNIRDFSMYELYNFYGICLTHAHQSLECIQLDRNEARILGIDTDQSVFRMACTTFSNEEVIEYALTYVRSDLCQFSVQFGGPEAGLNR